MIISIANNKGGVGKSTVTINLSAALVRKGYKVLMIDLDSQASLTLYCGINPEQLEYTSYDFLLGNATPIFELEEGMHIMPASINLGEAEISLLPQPGKEYFLKNQLAKIKGNYDYILIDNGPSLGILTINSLTASDYVIAPCIPEKMPYDGLQLINGFIEQIKQVNPDIKLMGVFVTMIKTNVSHHKEIFEAIKEDFPTFNAYMKNTVKFIDAGLVNKSIFGYMGDKFEGGQVFMDLAEEVVQYGR